MNDSDRDSEYSNTSPNSTAYLSEYTPVPYQALTSDETIVAVNDAWTDLLGYDQKTVQNEWFGDFLTPESTERFSSVSSSLSTGSVSDIELEIVDSENRKRRVVCAATAESDEDGTVRRTHWQLYEQSTTSAGDKRLRRFRQAVESAGHAVFITDVSGRIEYVNPAFETITGYDAEEAIGRTPRILKSGEMSDEYYDSLWSAILSGDIWSEEIINRRKSGELYTAQQTIAPIVENGDVTAFVSIQQDITEQKNRIEELRRQQAETERLQRLLEQVLLFTDTYVWEWNLETDEITRYPSVNAVFGVSEEELGHRYDGFIERVHPDDKKQAQNAFRTGIESAEGYTVEYRFRDGSDTWRWVCDRGEVMTTEDGTPVRAIGSITDIGERKKRDRQLRILDRVLRHNLRNDINVVRGRARTIRAEARESHIEHAQKIIGKSNELVALADRERQIADMLQNPPPKTSVDIETLLQHAVHEISAEHPEASITYEVPGEVVAVAVPQLEQATIELLENSIVHSDRDIPEIRITVTTTSENVHIKIADNGPGIPEQERQLLKGKQRVDPLHHNLGLGLWFVDIVVHYSDGIIEFCENDPRGTVVAVQLARN